MDRRRRRHSNEERGDDRGGLERGREGRRDRGGDERKGDFIRRRGGGVREESRQNMERRCSSRNGKRGRNASEEEGWMEGAGVKR